MLPIVSTASAEARCDDPEAMPVASRVTRYKAKDTVQIAFRRALAKLDEDQLDNIEMEIDEFLRSGDMAHELAELLEVAEQAA